MLTVPHEDDVVRDETGVQVLVLRHGDVRYIDGVRLMAHVRYLERLASGVYYDHKMPKMIGEIARLHAECDRLQKALDAATEGRDA